MKYILLIALTITAGCARHPPARLELALAASDPRTFDVRFASDTRFESLYVDSFFQSPGTPAFICSNEKTPRFDVEFETNNIARGMIKYEGTGNKGNKRLFYYRAHLIFWTTDKESPREAMLSADEVMVKLQNHRPLACRVRLSVYMGPPYYSETLYIPAAVLIDMAKKISAERGRFRSRDGGMPEYSPGVR